MCRMVIGHRALLGLAASVIAVFAVALACGGGTEQVVKEVIKEVPVEKEVIKEVVKEVPVEKEVIKEVVKEVVVTAVPPTIVKASSVRIAQGGGTRNYAGFAPGSGGCAHFTPSAHIFDSLVRNNVEAGEFVPRLATKWDRINPTTIRISLRSDVKYHNGADLTSDDVLATWEHMQSDDGGAGCRGVYAAIKEVQVVDDLTVDLIGAAYGLRPLMGIYQPTDRATLERLGTDAEGFNVAPVGQGAFELVKVETDVQVDLKPFQGYWGDVPELDVTFIAVSELATKVAMLLTGQVDIIDQVPPHMVPRIEDAEGFEIRTAGSMRAFFLSLNTFEKPFDDLRVRQAVAYAIDVPRILDKLFAGKGNQLGTVGASSTQYYNPDLPLYKQDLDKAKALLADAGYPNGIEVTFDSPAGFLLSDKEAAQVIADDLAKAGIKTDFNAAAWGTFWPTWVGTETQIAYVTCGNVYYSANFCHRLHFHSGFRGIYYNHPELDAMFDNFDEQSDVAAQREAMHGIQQWVNRELPYIPLYDLGQVFGVNSDLKWQPFADERYYMHEASWR